jgi:hypothetical protein
MLLKYKHDGKVIQRIPDIPVFVRINYFENREQRTVYCEVFEVFISRSVSSLNAEGRPKRCLPCTLPVSRKRFTGRDIVDLFGTGEPGNVSLTYCSSLHKSEMPGSFRQ